MTIVRGPRVGESYPLAPGVTEWVFGRSGQSTHKIEDDGASRRHFRITQTGQKFAIEDLGSLNGTTVNGAAVSSLRPLLHGDSIAVCGVTLRFLIGEDKAQGLPSVTDVSLQDGSPPLAMNTVRLNLQTGDPSLSQALRAVDAQTRLNALLEIANALRQTLDLDVVLEKILERLLAIFPQADRGFVVLCEGPERVPSPRARKLRKDDGAPLVLSRTILSEVIDRGQAILSRDVLADERFAGHQSVVGFSRTLICAPLSGRDGVALGAIQLDGLRPGAPFREEDLTLLAAIAGPPAIAIENARMHEASIERERLTRDMEFARRVQHSFLPSKVPQLQGYLFADQYKAAGSVGGDYFDYVELPDGRVAVIVADVAGKGVAAALEMARLSAEARFSLATTTSPAEVVTRLNERLGSLFPAGHYVTLALAVLDPASHLVEVVNAGHLPPLLVHAGRPPREVCLEEGGFPLALIPGTIYASVQLQLQPGESLLMFTDGVTEAMDLDDEPFGPMGSDRLARAVEPCGAQPKQLTDALIDAVTQWRGAAPQSDDICIVAFGRLAE
ncbi:MAG: SpoIIE family protein phosphatase [Acidobacteriota bacterium]